MLLTLSVAAATSRGAGGAEVYALTGGRVVTVSGAVLEDGTVVLRDGVIEAVGAGTPAPADARVIDVKGLTLTPGIIDGFGGVGLPAPAPAALPRAATARPRPARSRRSPSCSTASAPPTP